MLDITEITNIVVIITVLTTLLGFTTYSVTLRVAVYLNRIGYQAVSLTEMLILKYKSWVYSSCCHVIEISIIYILH
jgi:hypothetical protein